MLADDLLPTDCPLVRKDKHGDRYTERPCENCGNPAWMTKRQRYCSLSCANQGRSQDEAHSGANSPGWIGDDAGYDARHQRTSNLRGKASDHGCYNRKLGLRACTSDRYEVVAAPWR
jgi:hypothetical protein